MPARVLAAQLAGPGNPSSQLDDEGWDVVVVDETSRLGPEHPPPEAHPTPPSSAL